jgi:hypothetical protein
MRLLLSIGTDDDRGFTGITIFNAPRIWPALRGTVRGRAGAASRAADMDLDPNRWLGNVEVVVARDIGRETIQYVSNIYKYYVTYGLVVDRMVARGELKREGRS